MKEYTKSILSLPRYSKITIAIITDICMCIFCTWLAFVIRLEEIILFKDINFFPSIISIIIAIPIFWICGIYKTIFRFAGLSIIFTVTFSIILYGFLFFLVIGVYGIEEVPRSIAIIQPMLLFFAITSSRLIVKYLLTLNFKSYKNSNKQNILIYGAGEAGRQLLITLENNPEFKVVGFLDDNNQLHNQTILNHIVHSPSKLEKLIQSKDVIFIFLALPSIGRNKRNQILETLNKYKITVKTLPSISEIVDGTITISDIKDLNIDDLLSRNEIKPDTKLLNKNIHKQTVLVTGAGGSIGSEICRQIIRLDPNKLILLELNEFALYSIQEELKKINKNISITALLANTQDQSNLETIFETFKVNTVYHAAAYKHVHLVEENVCEGVKNNVFSTLSVVNAAIKKNISTFVLISSDKAVRPTNMMGASKRLSELCVQAIFNDNKSARTNFSIVRFGNVLESSGSVIPKFTKQIKEGGPITLRHKDVSRYFMTVIEAAQLVIQAGAMGKNAEVFVLDMGNSIKIKDIIEKMIKLSGLTIKDTQNPTGDIEIKITGLKPGEKLHEELLIGDNPQKTNHPKIQKASDPYILFDQLNEYLTKLKFLIANNNANEVKNYLHNFIKSYVSNADIIDHIYIEKNNNQKK
tara:strand:- start:5 stop:1921 length:1917 start_codon:yes stop_codon:yes gene_type:complete